METLIREFKTRLRLKWSAWRYKLKMFVGKKGARSALSVWAIVKINIARGRSYVENRHTKAQQVLCTLWLFLSFLFSNINFILCAFQVELLANEILTVWKWRQIMAKVWIWADRVSTVNWIMCVSKIWNGWGQFSMSSFSINLTLLLFLLCRCQSQYLIFQVDHQAHIILWFVKFPFVPPERSATDMLMMMMDAALLELSFFNIVTWMSLCVCVCTKRSVRLIWFSLCKINH